MTESIEDRVVDLYYDLFHRLFSEPFGKQITQRLKRDSVYRQIQEAAAAASQSSTRYLVNTGLTEQPLSILLRDMASFAEHLRPEDIANPRFTPEAVIQEMRTRAGKDFAIETGPHGPIFRESIFGLVQVLLLVGPVMREWEKLHHAETFALPRQIIAKLNQISDQMSFLGSGQGARDERYELGYRDYLLQRFYRVEAGTIRMTTNLAVDLREFFVMPRLRNRQTTKGLKADPQLDGSSLQKLAEARERFLNDYILIFTHDDKIKRYVDALAAVQDCTRLVLIGAPGSGKSTLLEWLQLQIAAAQVELVAGGQQAIPLLLRIRQLDPQDLPFGASLIEKATASKDRATTMPPRWIDRQLDAGRVLFMLDGLDEVEPSHRDKLVIPWLKKIIHRYPKCRYLLSSRPVGFPPRALRSLKFQEFELADFNPEQVAEFTRLWCTAVRLAQNESHEEARREGILDGKTIVGAFSKNPYIRDLARNPLMLSAICLVNYFEGGNLPEDRAVLYRLCVEGLLHNWDQRRGIRSDFTLEEKLRVCRELAITMQVEDLAEFEEPRVIQILQSVFKDQARASALLQHMRYRTGLLVERRPRIFAFAHLTFQEFLAAVAIHEGNSLGVDLARLAIEHRDPRWREVIELFCSIATTDASTKPIKLILQTEDLSIDTARLVSAYSATFRSSKEGTGVRSLVISKTAQSLSPWNLTHMPACAKEECLTLLRHHLFASTPHSPRAGAAEEARSNLVMTYFMLELEFNTYLNENLFVGINSQGVEFGVPLDNKSFTFDELTSAVHFIYARILDIDQRNLYYQIILDMIEEAKVRLKKRAFSTPVYRFLMREKLELDRMGETSVHATSTEASDGPTSQNLPRVPAVPRRRRAKRRSRGDRDLPGAGA